MGEDFFSTKIEKHSKTFKECYYALIFTMVHYLNLKFKGNEKVPPQSYMLRYTTKLIKQILQNIQENLFYEVKDELSSFYLRLQS